MAVVLEPLASIKDAIENKTTKLSVDLSMTKISKPNDPQTQSNIQFEVVPFLHISRKPPRDLVYLTAFHLIGTCSSEEDGSMKLHIKLLTFHGKLLQSETIPLETETLNSQLLQQYENDEYKLCTGISKHHHPNLEVNTPNSGLLIEYLDGNIVYRSRKCHFAIKDAIECPECRRFDSSEKKPVIPANTEPLQPPLVDVKAEVIETEPLPIINELEDLGIFGDPSTGHDLFDGEDETADAMNEALARELAQSYYGRPSKKKKRRRKADLENESQHEGGSKIDERCPKCNKIFHYKYSYLKHYRKCVEGLDEELPKRKASYSRKAMSSEVKWEFTSETCRLCLQHFKVKGAFDRHIAMHRERHNNLDEPVNCPLGCDVPSKWDLSEHYMSTHDKEMACCALCLVPMKRPLLQGHFIRAHNYPQNKHLCQECGRSFKFPGDLKNHDREVHDRNPENSVFCDQCGKAFPTRKSLMKHIRSSHTKTKVYQCPQCDKFFYENYRLQKHLRIHTGIKPFKCRHCQYRSTRKDNVRLHLKKVHKLTPSNEDVETMEHLVVDPILPGWNGKATAL